MIRPLSKKLRPVRVLFGFNAGATDLQSQQFGDLERVPIFEPLEQRRLLAGYTFTALAGIGGNPTSGVILLGNTLYGTEEDGGGYSEGAVFSLPVSGGTPTILATFNGSNGAHPFAGLTLSGETLYGTTEAGGANGDGTVFSVPLSGGTPTTLATFNGSNGAHPYAGVVLSGTTLYGTTYNGGSGQLGTVFSVPATGGAVNTLVNFNGYNGGEPYGGLTLSAGVLYGTYQDAGAFYSLPIAGGTPKQLASIGGDTYGTPTLFNNTLYATADDSGSLVSVPATGGSATTLASFTGPNGTYWPYASPIVFNNTLFGTTDGDGIHNEGTVYAEPLNGGAPVTLVAFNRSNGAYPFTAGVVADSSGDLYGTTDVGTVYKLSPPQTINLTGTNYLELDSANPNQLDVWNSTTNSGTPAATYLLSQYGSIADAGTAGNDTLTVDFSRGNPLTTFLPGVQYDLSGSSGGTDAVVIVGDSNGDTFNASNGLMLVSGGSGATAFSAAAISFSGINSETIHAGTGPDAVWLANGVHLTYVAPAGGVHPVADVPSITIGAGSVLAFRSPTSARALLEMISSENGAYWQGELDLGSNDFLSNGLYLSTQYIASDLDYGYANGTWSGTAIGSSAAASNSAHLTALGIMTDTTAAPFDGVNGNSSDALVKYTYYGDTNLDGRVDGTDYSRIDNGYLTHLNGWFNGDFNYDGIINGSDYTLIDNAYNTQGASLAARIAPAAEAAKASRLVTRPVSVFSQLQVSAPPADSIGGWEGQSNNVAAGIFATDDSPLRAKSRYKSELSHASAILD